MFEVLAMKQKFILSINRGSLVKLFQLTISSGICVPAVCSVDNVIEFASELLSSANLEVESVSCKTNDSVAFTAIDVIAM